MSRSLITVHIRTIENARSQKCANGMYALQGQSRPANESCILVSIVRTDGAV